MFPVLHHILRYTLLVTKRNSKCLIISFSEWHILFNKSNKFVLTDDKSDASKFLLLSLVVLHNVL